MKAKIDKETVIAVVVCITVLEIVALLKGIDGTLLRLVLIALAIMGGVAIPTPKFLQKP